ncbi:MAG: DsbE family thiol:disulfide interchange protein, partial [Lautropia mirabilis]|nr:DsbE family thiol:disulfide interchange protein [Lautropia mirabilis]
PEYALPRLADAPASIGRRALAPGNSDTSAGQASADAGAGADAKGANDNLVSSQALRGQPYLLNVWASWCMPCLQEHPQMVALAQSHRIRIVGMNYKDQPADARRWLARNGNPYDEIVVDAQGRTAIDFGVYGVPETFLIDAEGRIRYKLTGALSVQTLQDQLLPAIAALESNGQPSGNTSPRPNPAP